MKLQGYYKLIALLILLFFCANGYSQNYYYDGIINGLPNISRPVTKISTTVGAKTVSGEYLTILGKNHTSVVKPFVFVEGIDFLNTTDFFDHIYLLNNKDSYQNDDALNKPARLIQSLYNNGYDVIILDYDNATDYIQNNAKLLAQLLNDIYANNALSEDNFVVMGFSMGGLVARYALTWMEANGQNHHTRLFISHDSPQKGANFPLGLQELIEDIKYNSGYVGVLSSIFMTLFDYKAPAASQMLIYHYQNSKNGVAKPSDLSVNFFSELYNLSPTTNGFPSKPVKIALSNGNYSGIAQKVNLNNFLNPGDKILDFTYTKDNGWGTDKLCACKWGILQIIFGCDDCPDIEYEDDIITATVRAGFDDSKALESFELYSGMKHTIGNTNAKIPLGGVGSQVFKSSNYSYDNAPGSFSSNYMTLLKTSIENSLGVNVEAVNTTCFIPTISALDLNIDVKEPFNIAAGSQCYTNFDYIYANSFLNNEHFFLSSGGEQFILNHLFANETPLQKTLYSDIDLNIPIDKYVNSGELFNKTVKNSVVNTGNFKINVGGSSSLIAGQSIHLTSGFTVNSGGVFRASIAQGVLCSTPVSFIPRKVAQYVPSDITAQVMKIYDCSNYKEMPNYNPHQSYRFCPSDSVQFTTAQIDSVLSANITVYPNPTTGIMNITFSQGFAIDKVKVQIYDSMSNLIYSINSIPSNNVQINLPYCLPGLLTVQFDIDNGSYLYTKKIIKQ